MTAEKWMGERTRLRIVERWMIYHYRWLPIECYDRFSSTCLPQYQNNTSEIDQKNDNFRVEFLLLRRLRLTFSFHTTPTLTFRLHFIAKTEWRERSKQMFINCNNINDDTTAS